MPTNPYDPIARKPTAEAMGVCQNPDIDPRAYALSAEITVIKLEDRLVELEDRLVEIEAEQAEINRQLTAALARRAEILKRLAEADMAPKETQKQAAKLAGTG
jgi:chromosome segregation ATPase